jgi:hypothetical protein
VEHRRTTSSKVDDGRNEYRYRLCSLECGTGCFRLTGVGKDDRLEECNVTEKGEEIDDEGFITVRTKRAKQESKRSKKVNVISDLESKKCKVVSRVILLKQSS